MSRLVGGVAHDLNGLLTAISGYAALLLEALMPDDEQRADLEEVLTATRLAASLTRQLLAASRQQALQHAPHDPAPRKAAEPLELNAVLAAAAPLLRPLLGTAVQLELRPAPGPLLVRIDRTQLERVLLNLALNARDAMPEGGTLRLELGVAASELAARPSSATLHVRDTGVGMPPEVQARLFEPFFTTKPPSQGTGLGMATVQAIVQQAGGTIGVASRPGAGTTVTIALPLVAATPGTRHRPPVPRSRR